MSRKRKKEESSKDLLSFFEEEKPEPEEKPQREEVKVTGLEDKILSFIRKSGRVAKSSLYKWAKKQSISPAELYKSVRLLQNLNLPLQIRSPLD